MQRLFGIVSKLSHWMTMIGNVVLTFSILLTVADVILRTFRRPIVGTFELVAFSSALIFGFSIPYTSWKKGHINVDSLVLKLPQAARKTLNVITKCTGIGLFLIIGWNLIILGMDLRKAGEVSPTLQIPFYPIPYGVGICCFIECLVLFCDVVKILGGKNE